LSNLSTESSDNTASTKQTKSSNGTQTGTAAIASPGYNTWQRSGNFGPKKLILISSKDKIVSNYVLNAFNYGGYKLS